jgi:hypothetical protein
MSAAKELVSRLDVVAGRIELPHDRVPPQAELEYEMAELVRAKGKVPGIDSDAVERNAAAMREWLADLKAARLPDDQLAPIPVRISILRIGSGAIVFLPNEIFCETGQQIARDIGATPTFVAAYCHGFTGYVPPAAAHPQGGYEVDVAHRYLEFWRTAPDATDVLRREVRELWAQVSA